MVAATPTSAPVLPNVPIEVAAVIGAVVAGALVGVAGTVGVALVVGVLFAIVVSRKPMVGILALVISTPVLSGYARGVPVPFFRPHDLVLAGVLAGVGINTVVGLLQGRRWRLDLQPTDRAFGFLALFGSVVPILLSIGRSRPIDGEGIGQVMILPKYLLLFLLFRGVVRSTHDVRRVIVFSVLTGIGIAGIGIAQAFVNSQVTDVLLSLEYQPTDYLLSGRGTSTTGNSIIYGTLMALLVVVTMSVLFSHLDEPFDGGRAQRRRSIALTFGAVLFFLGVISSAQVSPVIALVVGLIVALTTARKARYFFALPPTAALGVLAIWPQVRRRLDDFEAAQGLPTSWQSRLDNLERFFLPEFADELNRVFGVRTAVTIHSDLVLGNTVFLESGYIWFVWVGGVFLLIAALAFLLTGFRQVYPIRRDTDPWVRAAATASVAAFIYITLLLTIDQHLTLRASTDLFVMLLAAAMCRTPAPVRFDDDAEVVGQPAA